MTVCDFCSSPDVRWAFPARPFVKEIDAPGVHVDWGSYGGWAACQECHDLIVAGKRDELTARAAAPLVAVTRLPSDFLEARLRELHDKFWSNRNGDPVPTTPGAPDPT